MKRLWNKIFQHQWLHPVTVLGMSLVAILCIKLAGIVSPHYMTFVDIPGNLLYLVYSSSYFITHTYFWERYFGRTDTFAKMDYPFSKFYFFDY